MSLDFSYRCHEHTPPILSPSINGSSLLIPALEQLWAHRVAITCLRNLDSLDVAIEANSGHRLNQLATWLSMHERCTVDIVDDEGNEYPLVKVVPVEGRPTT